MADLVLPPVARPNYFTGEALLTGDFICEQTFQMGALAAMNGALHTYGIAAGLEVQWHRTTQPNQVHVSAGMAIDRLGREIVLSEPRLITLSNIEAGATYYLTIRYHEVYGDLTDESGVLGYKRLIQQPQISYERTLRDAGENILLAVLTFTQQGAINSLAYRAGRDERRYVGGRFGSLRLITEGDGIATVTDGTSTASKGPAVQLVARRETDGSGLSFLEAEAERSQFSGQLTTRGCVGIGTDHPTANLQINTVTTKGRGTFTTNDTELTLSLPISPALQPGDLFIPDVSAALPAPQPAQVTIADAMDNSGQRYHLTQAFASNFTRPTSFTFVRTTLARVTDAKTGDLLSVKNDGTLWLGTLAKPGPGDTLPGPGVLSISPGRQVGIGLSGDAMPQSTLQVAGSILTDELISNGAVKAQSFEGNGAKLTNLSFLSYWTKTNVAASNSPLYYNQGNVGVQVTTPPATLTAGTTAPLVGSGLISWNSADPFKITGFQTLFTSEVGFGDTITVGQINARQTIDKIISDSELQLSAQFTVVVQKSNYQSLSPEAAADAKPQVGPGTISSDGTTVIGKDTRFSTLKEGDFLVIPGFQPVEALFASWMVDTVTSDTELTLQKPTDGSKPNWEANVSAYMISSGLMGYFQSNQGQALKTAKVAPAMVVKANGANGTGSWSDNTVAINMWLKDTDPKYALQVNGAVSFSGHSVFDDLLVETLTVTKSLTVNGDGSADKLVSIGQNGAATPLLTVTRTNVQLGTVGSSTALLSVGGDASITGTLSATTATGGTVTSTGAMSCGGLFTSKSLSVSGVAINADSSVQLFGSRTAYNQSNMTGGTFSAVAATDGMVLAVLGTIDPNLKTEFASMLTAATATPAGTSTGVIVAAASTHPYTYSKGKKGSVTLQIPTFGTITMPVRKGETWTLTKTDTPAETGIHAASLYFYWMPLGSGAATVSGTTPTPQARMLAATSSEPSPFQGLEQSASALRANVMVNAPSMGVIDRTALAEAQRIIDGRVSDLTQILGDATEMDAAPDARAAFIRDLQSIVCRADPKDALSGQTLEDGNIQALIDTFGHLTGHSFTADQRTLLAAGVRALVEINANDRNRHDLDLIKANIGFFLENMETALGLRFDARQRRPLTRALVRLVGDGSQNLPSSGDDAADTAFRAA